MTCSYCNHTIPDDSEFCSFCGNKLPPRVSEQNPVSKKISSIQDFSETKEGSPPQKRKALSIITAALALLLVISVVFNALQYSGTSRLKEDLSLTIAQMDELNDECMSLRYKLQDLGEELTYYKHLTNPYSFESYSQRINSEKNGDYDSIP